MTCIVGIEHNGKVLIGGDSAGVAGYSLTVRADEKVFESGEFIFGFTTSFRMGQLLRYKLTPPPFPENPDLDSFMATSFIDAVRQVFRDGGWLELEDNVQRGGTFLVGVRGRLYTIASDFQIGRSLVGYNAVGCGCDLAMGALYATRTTKSARNRAQIALEAAAEFSAGVVAPFNFVETKVAGQSVAA